MSRIEDLFILSAAFAEHRHIGESRVSTLVFNDGKRLRQIRDGADVGVRILERAIQWFSDNWPDGLAWPDGITRPEARGETPNDKPEAAE